MDATRALLDELMGKVGHAGRPTAFWPGAQHSVLMTPISHASQERNVPLGERSGRRIRYDDPDVCKFQLGGLCPNRLFKNTRSDLGGCVRELGQGAARLWTFAQ